MSTSDGGSLCLCRGLWSLFPSLLVERPRPDPGESGIGAKATACTLSGPCTSLPDGLCEESVRKMTVLLDLSASPPSTSPLSDRNLSCCHFAYFLWARCSLTEECVGFFTSPLQPVSGEGSRDCSPASVWGTVVSIREIGRSCEGESLVDMPF